MVGADDKDAVEVDLGFAEGVLLIGEFVVDLHCQLVAVEHAVVAFADVAAYWPAFAVV